jgi:hypothetical protein
MAHELVERIRVIGPYLLLELFMPGGTLLAYLLFLYRRKKVVAQLPEEANTSAMTGAAPQGTFLVAQP